MNFPSASAKRVLGPLVVILSALATAICGQILESGATSSPNNHDARVSRGGENPVYAYGVVRGTHGLSGSDGGT
jgi:hypothetical protein